MEKLQISKNGRYFTYPDGTPFVWLADTAWTMPQRMKWDDVTYFMEERKRQGFTVLQIVALDPSDAECAVFFVSGLDSGQGGGIWILCSAASGLGTARSRT